MAIWPFGRRRDADEPNPEPAADASASPSGGGADVARPERDPSGDWMTVPPVRTSMAPAMPTTFRVQTLPEILTSHQDSRLSSSLGHAVSSDAPSGVIGGLASATSSLGAVSHEGTGGAPSELHEPARAAKPEPEPAMPTQRRLTATADTPLAVSTPGALGSVAPPAPALPEPAVSRVLASPAPMPSPASLGANPLPVARVVDTTPAAGRTTASAAPGPAPEAPSTSGGTLDGPTAPEPGPADDRVGGFEVDLTTLLGPSRDEDLPTITPPTDLAPPIQRSVRRDAPPTLRAPVQRSAEPAAPAPGPSMPAITPASPSPATSGASPASSSATDPATTDSDVAPAGTPAGETAALQRQALPGATPAPSTGSPSPPSAPEAGSAASAGESNAASEASEPSAPTAPGADRPTVGREPVAGTTDAPSLTTAGGAVPSGPGTAPSDLPLVAPALQRAAEADDVASGTHFPGDGHDHGDDAGAVQRSVDSVAASLGASADPHPSSPAGEASTGETSAVPEGPSATGEASPPATAPLAGEDPLAPMSAVGPHDEGTDEPAAPPTAEDLPLVARLAEPSAPTLGTDGGGGSGLVPLQTLSEPEPARTDSTASLPLAPPEQPGAITPPAPRASASTGLVGDGPAPLVTGSSSGGAPSAGTPRPLAAQRRAESAVATGPGPTAPTAGAPTTPSPGPLAFVAQRQAASTAGGAAATSAPAALRPLSSSAGNLLLAAPSSASGTGGAAPSTMTVLGAPPADAPAVPLHRSFDADAVTSAEGSGSAAASSSPAATSASAAGATSSGALPLARSAAGAGSGPATPVTPLIAQRAADGAGAGADAPGRSAMPLHTAAAAVPSTTDLLVKAGLGEKAPDGSFLRSTPPAGVESSFTVQTLPEAGAAPSTPATAPVQRALTVDSVTTTASDSTGGSGGAGSESPEDVRKLYRKLRAELEADLRRQLEAKSRYNRYRP